MVFGIKTKKDKFIEELMNKLADRQKLLEEVITAEFSKIEDGYVYVFKVNTTTETNFKILIESFDKIAKDKDFHCKFIFMTSFNTVELNYGLEGKNGNKKNGKKNSNKQ